jgi:multidrug efflux pump subunit AcrA (membrane-fusion protein)
MEALEKKREAELEWNRATASLDLHQIRSPLTGVVVERLLAVGEQAKLHPILKLAQIDPLLVEVFMPLSWLGKLQPGMKAEVKLQNGELVVNPAVITVVNRVVDSASATFGVRLEMTNPDNALPPGMACTVDFH